MKNRLVYEVRLRKGHSPKAAKGKPWRWDVTYYMTTDPEYPGVETGRWHLSNECGYEKFKWQALRKIAKHITDNPFKHRFVER